MASRAWGLPPPTCTRSRLASLLPLGARRPRRVGTDASLQPLPAADRQEGREGEQSTFSSCTSPLPEKITFLRNAEVSSGLGPGLVSWSVLPGRRQNATVW